MHVLTDDEVLAEALGVAVADLSELPEYIVVFARELLAA